MMPSAEQARHDAGRRRRRNAQRLQPVHRPRAVDDRGAEREPDQAADAVGASASCRVHGARGHRIASGSGLRNADGVGDDLRPCRLRAAARRCSGSPASRPSWPRRRTTGANSAPFAVAYFFSASDFMHDVLPDHVERLAARAPGRPSARRCRNSWRRACSPRSVEVIGGMVPKPSSSSGWSDSTASGRSRLPRIICACSTASWVVISVSPATVAITAGLPPS